jgi:hypothetical protein
MAIREVVDQLETACLNAGSQYGEEDEERSRSRPGGKGGGPRPGLRVRRLRGATAARNRRVPQFR